MACDKSRTWRKGKVGLRHAYYCPSRATSERLALPTLFVTVFIPSTYFLYQSNLHGAFSLIAASIHPWLPHSHGLFP
jgi:hypothetical protein